MRILIHDRSGHAFPVQLSRELARRGYQVLHSYGTFFQTPKGDLIKRDTDPDTLTIQGIDLDEPFQKYSFVKRHFQEMEYARRFVAQIQSFNPDVLILAQIPPDAQAYIHKQLRGSGKKIIFWVQDVYGIAIKRILSQKYLLIGDWVGWYYIYNERKLLRESDAVVLITEDFKPLMRQWRIAENKQYVIPNWATLTDIPAKTKQNPWSEMHKLDQTFNIIYSGTLGMKHNPDLLLQLATQLKDNSQVRVVVISEGLGANWLADKKTELVLDNLILFEFQPFDQLSDVLATADILTAILEPDAGVYSVPSKVLTYLCAQRSLLLAVPLENLSARIVAQNQAGLVVPSDNVEGFVEAAKTLLTDDGLREKFGENARHYAIKNFNITTIGDKFEEIILE